MPSGAQRSKSKTEVIFLDFVIWMLVMKLARIPYILECGQKTEYSGLVASETLTKGTKMWMTFFHLLLQYWFKPLSLQASADTTNHPKECTLNR